MTNKYEQLIEFIINDESDKARELFHTIVVEKSRDIYESLIDETDLEGQEVQEIADEVAIDEQGISEEEEEEGAEEAPAFDSEEEAGDEFGAEDQGEAEIEDRVVDLEDALDELKAEFDALMAGEAGEEEHADHFGAEEHGADEGGEEQSEFMEAKEEDEEDEEEEEVEESIVREYVEKVADQGQKSEGGEVAAGKSASINAKSTVAGKNDMGGSSANIAKGGEEKGAPAKKPQVNNAGNINVPGGKAGSAFKTKEAAKAGEGQTTDGKVAVGTKSPLAK